jgi:hypothetical protein
MNSFVLFILYAKSCLIFAAAFTYPHNSALLTVLAAENSILWIFSMYYLFCRAERLYFHNFARLLFATFCCAEIIAWVVCSTSIKFDDKFTVIINAMLSIFCAICETASVWRMFNGHNHECAELSDAGTQTPCQSDEHDEDL